MFVLPTLIAQASTPECWISLDGILPDDGQAEVPVDMVPSAIFTGNWSCQEANDWEIELLRGEDMEVIARERFSGSEIAGQRWASLPHEGLLDPETAYTLRITEDDAGAIEPLVIESGFTTGSGLIAGLEGVPAFTDVQSDYSDSAFTLEWTATPASDPDALSIIQTVSDNFRLGSEEYLTPCSSIIVGTEPMLSGACMSFTGFAPGETCVSIRQIDGLAQATAWSDETCVEVIGGCEGCQAVRLSGLGFVSTASALLCILAVARRAPPPQPFR